MEDLLDILTAELSFGHLAREKLSELRRRENWYSEVLQLRVPQMLRVRTEVYLCGDSRYAYSSSSCSM